MATRLRITNEINAGSMADIAFLLLIFFLVTTTIKEEKGILIKLPPYTPDSPITDYKERNVFSVFINAKNELLVRGHLLSKDLLKQQAKLFILNPNHDNKMAENPTKAVISLKNDRGTGYSTYIMIYNELSAAYHELWEEFALSKYKKSFHELKPQQIKQIRETIPLLIIEAESSAFGHEN